MAGRRWGGNSSSGKKVKTPKKTANVNVSKPKLKGSKGGKKGGKLSSTQIGSGSGKVKGAMSKGKKTTSRGRGGKFKARQQ